MEKGPLPVKYGNPHFLEIAQGNNSMHDVVLCEVTQASCLLLYATGGIIFFEFFVSWEKHHSIESN